MIIFLVSLGYCSNNDTVGAGNFKSKNMHEVVYEVN
jgi:hypothetical protein